MTDLAKLELISVSKRFGRVTAIDDVSLVVEDNELFCLFGPPGCGKSTILRLLLGLEAPDAGEIRIGGRDVTELPPADRDLAMVFQNLALFPHMNTRENLAFPLVARGADPKHITVKVDAGCGNTSYNSPARQGAGAAFGRRAAARSHRAGAGA